MIDDLVPAAVSVCGDLGPYNDWGFLMDKKNSLFRYFEKYILKKFPQIKGTIFLPMVSHLYIDETKGYKIYKKDIDSPDFLAFLSRIDSKFEMAFHGVKHAYHDKGKDRWVHECSELTNSNVEEITAITRQFCDKTGIRFLGGKFPGYKYNEKALKLIENIGSKWWALDADMLNKKHKKNEIVYDCKSRIIYLPSNITGDIFSKSLIPENRIKKQMKRFIKNRFHKDPVSFIHFLYKNRLPIIVQEHFQNQITEGKRQTPNIFDDIWSLDQIFSMIRGYDIWYATCSELAHYYDSYLNTKIFKISRDQFSIDYKGNWDTIFLSVESDKSELLEQHSGIKFHGIFKNGNWVFNNIIQGIYKVI